ncbi:MAG: hypothetical protein SHS37scaffold537_46 [Phage 68_12]|nr:MAG: hypothetical protein SHS37scaffold537_46 [Phage 68_12]
MTLHEPAPDVPDDFVAPPSAAPVEHATELEDVRRVNLQPDDTLVVRVNRDLITEADFDRIRTDMHRVFPGHPLLIMSADIELDVVGPDPAADIVKVPRDTIDALLKWTNEVGRMTSRDDINSGIVWAHLVEFRSAVAPLLDNTTGSSTSDPAG